MRSRRPEEAFYGWILRSYPPDFRARFGNEMIHVFSENIRNQYERRGFFGCVYALCSALWEVVSVAGPLRLKSSSAPSVVVSILASSILAFVFFAAVTPRCIK